MAAMKDIIIKLNVFDGLAHNTENVMSSVLQQEQKATDKHKILTTDLASPPKNDGCQGTKQANGCF